jgi:hypothetical protein
MRFFNSLFMAALLVFSVACGQDQNNAPSVPVEKPVIEATSATFSTEIKAGVTYVHNYAAKWRAEQKIRLELIAVIGGSETSDSNLTFHKPTDIALDKQGNLYVADSGNFRVQKLAADGTFLESFGREGQGPGEFQFIDGLAVDEDGGIYVTDKAFNTVKILSPEGKEIGTLPAGRMGGKIALLGSGGLVQVNASGESDALLCIYDRSGDKRLELGQEEHHADEDSYRYFNRVAFANDGFNNIYIAYATRNRIERYAPTGDLDLSVDRPLNFPISQQITYQEHAFGGRKIPIPFVNFVSADITLDDQGRLWVLSYERQLKFEEMGLTMHFRDGEGRYEGAETLQSSATTRIDAFAFHVFTPEGHFLGEVPLTHHAGEVKIFQDRLYILEPRHEMCVYAYRIIE